VNQFEIPDDGRRDPPKTQHYGNEQRGDFGAAAMFIFSPNFLEIVTVYGSRFDNRKAPSGGIEDWDFASCRTSMHDAALACAIRELAEETHITRDQLLHVAKMSVEDTIRGDMKRYYFVGIAKEHFAITPFRAKEDGKDHYVDHQRWERIENVLRGASHEGESYNTLYAIALVRVIQEMQEEGFDKISEFRDLLISLAFSRIHLDEQLVLLEDRREKENEARRQRRY
jgi:8-oxo-dGTP pyrophosphatase MutT (NUDIX family)